MADFNNSNRQYNPPNTVSRTSHSVTILGPDGNPIGLINGWNPTQSRDVTPIYELNVVTSGLPYENVPGNVRNLTISINRYDIWVKRMEDAFGSVSLDMLSRQNSPFSVVESWTKPDNSVESYQYDGCYFTQVGRSLRSDDNRIVNVNATLAYVFKHRIA